MSDFPRTTVGGVSVSRMIAGTNWFLGWSHCTPAKDQLIKDTVSDYRKMADVLEVFLNAGVDTVMGFIQIEKMRLAVEEAQQRTGRRAIVISTPWFRPTPRTPVEGFDPDEVKRVLDAEVEGGTTFCLPHSSCVDMMLDCCTRELRQIDQLCAAMRERGLIPALSTHRPESILYADETGLDVESYISIFNAMGFLMPLEVDWVARVIRNAKKPVMTIKPMAAGQLRPYQALTFVWNALRPCDMVTVGTMTPDEARELIDLSREILSGRPVEVPLQETRSKAAVKPRHDA